MKLPDELGIELVCPECRTPLVRIDETYLCTDGECRRSYDIHDGIPKLIVDDATILEDGTWTERVSSAKSHQGEQHGQST